MVIDFEVEHRLNAYNIQTTLLKRTLEILQYIEDTPSKLLGWYLHNTEGSRKQSHLNQDIIMTEKKDILRKIAVRCKCELV